MNDFTSQRGLVQLIVCFNMATYKGVILCALKTRTFRVQTSTKANLV